MQEIMFKDVFVKYVLATQAYGTLRRMISLWDGEVYSYDKKKHVPMLLGDKLSACAVSMAYAPILAPLWIVNDLNHVDIYMRRHKPDDYDIPTPRSWFDHVIR